MVVEDIVGQRAGKITLVGQHEIGRRKNSYSVHFSFAIEVNCDVLWDLMHICVDMGCVELDIMVYT
jgi:hypothetical protein